MAKATKIAAKTKEEKISPERKKELEEFFNKKPTEAEPGSDSEVIESEVEDSEEEETEPTVSEEDIQEALEAESEVEESDTEENEVEEQSIDYLKTEAHATVTLLKPICHVCRHLFPNLPETLPSKFGGAKKETPFGKEFPCHTEEGCPAQQVTILYNSISNEDMRDAVNLFKSEGDMSEVNDILEEAKRSGSKTFDSVHTQILSFMEER